MAALSTLGVVVFGASWLSWRLFWLLWPAALCAIALQISATMIAARSAVATRARDGRHVPRESLLPAAAPMDAAAMASAPGAPGVFGAPSAPDAQVHAPTRATTAPAEGNVEPTGPVMLSMPKDCPPPYDTTIHRAFFRRIVDAEFREYAPGLVWPDLGALQGSLSTRLRLFRRYASLAPSPASEISEHDGSPHSPWHHLAKFEAAAYRRGDAVARLSHRAFAPLAFLELHARIDLEPAERVALDEELARLYSIGFGRVLTPPAMLSAIEPLRHRTGGTEAIALADEARMALRSAHHLGEAERARGEWRARAQSAQELLGWSGDVLSMVEALVDYWLVQRAAAEDMGWADELVRLEGGTLGSALAQRDESGVFHFAEALQLVVGAPQRQAGVPTPAPTAASTVA